MTKAEIKAANLPPIIKAEMVYKTEPCARTFHEDLGLHFLNGYVFCTPDFFVMGRYVNRLAPDDQICDPNIVFPPDQQDCVHVYLIVGSISDPEIWRHMPRHVPWISVERAGKVCFFPYERLSALGLVTKPSAT